LTIGESALVKDKADIFTTDTLGTAPRLAQVMATFDPDCLFTAASRRP
jgi:hypothetical protein